MPFKDPEKRREAVRKSCKKAYWADPETARAKGLAKLRKHHDRIMAARRRRWQENPEFYRAKAREWSRAHPESRRLTRRKQMLKRRGLTLDDYDRMLAEQGGLCKICGQPETLVKNGVLQLLSVEHCHKTNRVRGLTCNTCNRGMGLFKDNPKLLRLAAAYLEA